MASRFGLDFAAFRVWGVGLVQSGLPGHSLLWITDLRKPHWAAGHVRILSSLLLGLPLLPLPLHLPSYLDFAPKPQTPLNPNRKGHGGDPKAKALKARACL